MAVRKRECKKLYFLEKIEIQLAIVKRTFKNILLSNFVQFSS